MEIVVLCPSRANPAGARDMVDSFYQTVDRIRTRVILVVDRNDPTLGDYLLIPEHVMRRWNTDHMPVDPPAVMILEDRETGNLSTATNTAAARVWDEDCIIGHVGDDHRFRTLGWDSVIRQTLIDAPGVAYAYDGFATKWASEWFTNSVIPRTLGWFALPGSMHLCIDDAFMLIGAGLGRLHYLPDMFIEHLHPASGKVPWRPVVRSYYEPAKFAAEKLNLLKWIEGDYTADIAKLAKMLHLEVVKPDLKMIDFLTVRAQAPHYPRKARTKRRGDWSMF